MAGWPRARHALCMDCMQAARGCLQNSVMRCIHARAGSQLASWQMARTVKMRCLPRAHIALADARARAAGPGHYYDQIHRARPAADQYFGQQAGQMRRAT